MLNSSSVQQSMPRQKKECFFAEEKKGREGVKESNLAKKKFKLGWKQLDPQRTQNLIILLAISPATPP